MMEPETRWQKEASAQSTREAPASCSSLFENQNYRIDQASWQGHGIQ
jgi:hypothetical protein